MDAGTDRHSGSSGLWARFSEVRLPGTPAFSRVGTLQRRAVRKTALGSWAANSSLFNPVCRSLVFILFDEFRRDSAILEVAMYGGIAHLRERLALSVPAPVPQQFRLASH